MRKRVSSDPTRNSSIVTQPQLSIPLAEKVSTGTNLPYISFLDKVSRNMCTKAEVDSLNNKTVMAS
jgi:hypothetical protein